MLYGAIERVARYEFPLKQGGLSLEMLLVWARHTTLSLERPDLVSHIEDLTT